MIMPVFINRTEYVDSDKHGFDCECKKCTEQKILDNKPKKYFYSCYAIPKKWNRKNKFYKILRFIPFIISTLVGIFVYFSLNMENTYHKIIVYMILWLSVSIITIVGFEFFDKFVKFDFECDDKVKLTKDFLSIKNWNEIKKENNLDNYILTEEKMEYEYI